MHYQKSEKTRRIIINEFYDLAGTSAGSPLPTVGEICGTLDISRSTFYCHFSGIDEIVDSESQKFIQMNADLQGKLGISGDSSGLMNKDQIRAIILSAQNHRKEAMFLFRPDVNSRCYQFVLQSIMQNMDSMLAGVSGPLKGYMSRYLGQGILSAVHQWVVSQDVAIDELVDMLYIFTIGSIERANAGMHE